MLRRHRLVLHVHRRDDRAAAAAAAAGDRHLGDHAADRPVATVRGDLELLGVPSCWTCRRPRPACRRRRCRRTCHLHRRRSSRPPHHRRARRRCRCARRSAAPLGLGIGPPRIRPGLGHHRRLHALAVRELPEVLLGLGLVDGRGSGQRRLPRLRRRRPHLVAHRRVACHRRLGDAALVPHVQHAGGAADHDQRGGARDRRVHHRSGQPAAQPLERAGLRRGRMVPGRRHQERVDPRRRLLVEVLARHLDQRAQAIVLEIVHDAYGTAFARSLYSSRSSRSFSSA